MPVSDIRVAGVLARPPVAQLGDVTRPIDGEPHAEFDGGVVVRQDPAWRLTAEKVESARQVDRHRLRRRDRRRHVQAVVDRPRADRVVARLGRRPLVTPRRPAVDSARHLPARAAIDRDLDHCHPAVRGRRIAVAVRGGPGNGDGCERRNLRRQIVDRRGRGPRVGRGARPAQPLGGQDRVGDTRLNPHVGEDVDCELLKISVLDLRPVRRAIVFVAQRPCPEDRPGAEDESAAVVTVECQVVGRDPRFCPVPLIDENSAPGDRGAREFDQSRRAPFVIGRRVPFVTEDPLLRCRAVLHSPEWYRARPGARRTAPAHPAHRRTRRSHPVRRSFR